MSFSPGLTPSMTAACTLVACLVFAVPALADLWGYEDAYGIVYLNSYQVDDRYVLIHEGEETPHIGFPEIKRILREKKAVEQERDTDWRESNIPDKPIRPFPPVRTSGPIVELINKLSIRHGVDPLLVYAMVEQESNFNVRAVSPKGAEGLMQIMPDTQQMLGLSDPFNASANIDAGIRYLKLMMKRYPELRLALAAYNAGPDAVAAHAGMPPYPETVDYVSRIILRYSYLLDSSMSSIE